MEQELKCPSCKQLFNNPVLLPCCHSLCLNCAVNSQKSHGHGQVAQSEQHNGDVDYLDGDRVSLLSETDSGVVVCNSRPNSYVGTPPLQHPVAANAVALSLTCPLCHKLVYFDENGAHNLPKNTALMNIVHRYEESKNLKVKCQLCEGSARDATIMCEQCAVFYCDSCRENCHPSRGPLAKHNLVSPQQGKGEMRVKNADAKCLEHVEQSLTMYCMLCKLPLCAICMHEARHANHDVQPLPVTCKTVKTELSQNLQTLSEKAKSATEFIQKLKSANDNISDRCKEIEGEISVECDELVKHIEQRKKQLIEMVRSERDYKIRCVKEQVSASTSKLQNTTAVLQFCIEALKETDHSAFLQIGSWLINRVCNLDVTWHNEFTSKTSSYSRLTKASDFNLTLDTKPVKQNIEQMTFSQMKPPGPPSLISEECIAENNSVTIAWQPHPSSFVEGYALELDGANDGSFREVYRGKESICTVDGLHFNSVYKARVKAFNSSGDGAYSVPVCLQTSEVAFFALDPITAHPDIVLTNDNMTVTCQSYEHRVVLGNIGFSRGVHYWEVTVDRYDNCTDPAIGIAKFDVAKDLMLGKDDKGWSMYIDNQRSWFMHFDKHESRTEGGIDRSSVIGVLLDLDNHQLCFYVNEEMQGPIAFDNLYGVFYPAFGVNRNVQLTVQSALDPPPFPSDHEGESDGAESGVGSATGATTR